MLSTGLVVTASLDYSVACANTSVIVRQFYHRVVSGVRMDAQTPASRIHA